MWILRPVGGDIFLVFRLRSFLLNFRQSLHILLTLIEKLSLELDNSSLRASLWFVFAEDCNIGWINDDDFALVNLLNMHRHLDIQHLFLHQLEVLDAC